MRELGAANWLIRYDAALREREKERACARDAKALRPSNSEGATSLVVASEWGETTSVARRRRVLPKRFVPLFAPELRPAPRLLGVRPTSFAASAPDVPDIEVVFSDTEETAAPSYPTLAELESEPPPIVRHVEHAGAFETSLYPTLAELEDSSPAPPVVLEGATEPMAMGSFRFDGESPYEESPSQSAPISLSDDILLGGCTEPMFPPEPSSRVVFIVVDKNVDRVATEPTETPAAQLEPPSAPLQLSLSPPPLLLTPPHWSDVVAEAQAPTVTAHALPRLLPAELPNPWAAEKRPADAVMEPESARPRPSRSLVSRFGRAATMTCLAVLAGAGVRSVVLYARPGLHRASSPVTNAAVPGEAASPNTTASTVPAAIGTVTGTTSNNASAHGDRISAAADAPPSGALASASAATTRPEGDVEVLAPSGVPVFVDGIPRGNGPRVALRVAPGYHMVRAGAKRPQLAEVRAGSLARVDLSAATD